MDSFKWLEGVAVIMLDLQSHGYWSDSCYGRYQVNSTWMNDCLHTGKPSLYTTNTKVNLTFHPSRVGEPSTSLSHARDYVGVVCRSVFV